MNRNIFISFGLHIFLVIITAMSLPFLARKPIDLPPIVSVELIQIADKTNIPFAPKAKKIIEKVKEKEKKLVSEQAPPKALKKEKQDAIPLPDEKIDKVKEIKEDKQNPEKVETEIKQVSEFEKKDLFDPSNIAALIDKSKVESAETAEDSTGIGWASRGKPSKKRRRSSCNMVCWVMRDSKSANCAGVGNSP